MHESERLTRLINNVLDFSQIERGQKVYRRELTSLAAIIRNVVNTMEYALARQGFELRVNVAEDLPTANIDADAMQQALLNLLGNAMKYSTDRRRIDLTLTVVDDHAVMQVTDYGLGIAPQDQTRLFERFYRAPSLRTPHPWRRPRSVPRPTHRGRSPRIRSGVEYAWRRQDVHDPPPDRDSRMSCVPRC